MLLFNFTLELLLDVNLAVVVIFICSKQVFENVATFMCVSVI